MKQFEEMIRESIIEAYIATYGEDKWNGLTDQQKDEVLHIVLNDFAKAIL